MAIGYISYINAKGLYGFIDCPELQLDDIFFPATFCNKLYKNIYKGDKVNFDLEINSEKEIEAKNISFIQNSSLDGLRRDYNNQNILKGILKKIDNKYYVKDQETSILIRIIIANYEFNLNEVYENNLNKMIEYKISMFTIKNKIRAININRQFLPECKLLIEGNKTEGLVDAKVKGGYQVKIYDNIIGFLPNSLALKSKVILEVGELINVICIKSSEDLSNVVFNLTENYEYETELQIEKEIFTSFLKQGDRFIGKIKVVKEYGVFVSFGLSEGLLHINKILGENYIIQKSSKKEFFKIIEQIFLKEKEIDIEIEEIIDDRISLVWNVKSERNKALYLEIHSNYIAFKA